MPADLVIFAEEILNRKLHFFLQWQKLIFASIWGNSPLKDNIILLTLSRCSFYVCLINMFVKGLVFRSSLDANSGNGFKRWYRRVPKLPKAHPFICCTKRLGILTEATTDRFHWKILQDSRFSCGLSQSLSEQLFYIKPSPTYPTH